MKVVFQPSIFRGYVSFRECLTKFYRKFCLERKLPPNLSLALFNNITLEWNLWFTVFNGNFQIFTPSSHNHGSVTNYPKWKEPNIGDTTPIFHFHDYGRKGKNPFAKRCRYWSHSWIWYNSTFHSPLSAFIAAVLSQGGKPHLPINNTNDVNGILYNSLG